MSILKYVQKKTGSVVYCAVYAAPDGSRRVEQVRTVSLKTTDKKTGKQVDTPQREHERAASAARSFAHEQLAKIRNGEWTDPNTVKAEAITFKKLTEKFLSGYRTKSGKMDYYESMIPTPLDYFGEKVLACEIRPTDVEAYRDSRLRLVSKSTARKDIAVLSTMFRWAKRKGYVKDNPADAERVKRPAEPKPNPRPRSFEEEAALLAACRDDLARVVRWLIYSGMDRGEIPGLTWSQVNEDAGIVDAPRAKTGAARTVYMNDELRAVIEACRAARKVAKLDGSDPVFLNAGKPWTIDALKTSLRRAYVRAGLDPHKPAKSLRHTFATHTALAGGNEFEVADALGHETTEMARVYVKVANDRRRELAERIGTKAHREAHKKNDAETSSSASPANG